MIDFFASTVVVLAAVYLIGLAAVSFFLPAKAADFLNGFAASALAHYTEISIRLIVGIALIVASPSMVYASAFTIFGWLLVVTSLVLLLFPWRWHHRFANVVVPPLTKRVWIFGVLSLPLGSLILFAVLN